MLAVHVKAQHYIMAAHGSGGLNQHPPPIQRQFFRNTSRTCRELTQKGLGGKAPP